MLPHKYRRPAKSLGDDDPAGLMPLRGGDGKIELSSPIAHKAKRPRSFFGESGRNVGRNIIQLRGDSITARGRFPR
jgi:hypothetical protein